MPRRVLTLGTVLCCLGLAGCVSERIKPGPQDAAAHHMFEFLDGVRIDPERQIVEFDATVAADCHDPETPHVYLEVICCTPDTREHESLVVTTVRPSMVHAALLAVGGSPGTPGSWRRQPGANEIVPIPPSGDRVRVTFITLDQDRIPTIHDPAAWIIHHGTGATMRESLPETAWVFAGSRIREYRGSPVYDADGTGQLIGLHTFGSECLAWTRIESPEAAIDPPRWRANADRMPAIGTPVTVRLEIISGD